MSPSISGYKNFLYRYYRCRSRAFGRPPCKDVGVSAYNIEEFVRATLSSETWELTEPADATTMQEFATIWRGLDNRQQSKVLANVLREVRFDPIGGSVTLSLHADAAERLRRA